MPEKNPFYGATFAERKAIREAAEKDAPADAEAKQVDAEADAVEDKAVRSSETKKRTPRKKS